MVFDFQGYSCNMSVESFDKFLMVVNLMTLQIHHFSTVWCQEQKLHFEDVGKSRAEKLGPHV